MLLGESVEPEVVRIPKARELVQLLQSEVLPFVSFSDVTRRLDGWELVQVEVCPEVPTFPANDIRFLEPILIEFDPEDRSQPNAIALRPDFPRVPHTYMVERGKPLRLCLFDEPYSEQRLLWTASAYLRQLKTWLSKTATGTLHQPGQSVEPFLPGSPAQVVLPSQLFEADYSSESQLLSMDVLPRNAPPGFTLVTRRQGAGVHNEPDLKCIALVVETAHQTQSGLTHHPKNLFQLREFLEWMNTDLFQVLHDKLRNWIIEQERDSAAFVLLVLRIPVRRSDDGTPEMIEVRAFQVAGSARHLGKSLGYFDEVEGTIGALIGEPKATSESQDLALLPLNPVSDLNRRDAQILSGTRGLPDSRILTVGAGALGSQTLLNLARGGFGTWTVIDHDVLLPHNLVRHALPGTGVGLEKARALSYFVNRLHEDGRAVDSLVADVLAYPTTDELRAKLDSAEVSVDFSASVAVARWLALDAPGDSRRISVFLNHDGTDLVILVEDRARSMRLDQIEAQYYGAVIERKEFEGHLLYRGEQLRYGRTCRDITSTLSQDTISLFSGIAARALKDRIANPESSLAIWRTSVNQSVSYHSVELAVPFESRYGDWRISTDKRTLQKLHDLRQHALPNETGGVLLGYPDQLHKVLYVVGALPSPPDSEEWPTSYVRGSEGLKQAIDEVSSRTAGYVGYLGEWHSHPDKSSCEPSQEDLQFLAWLTEYMFLDGMPGLMAIVCEDGEISWRTATLSNSKNPDDR
ncbi:MAG: hypothetical protein F4Y90_03120 [Rhodothermaceae bacterium]|nr:hypothetical protein [Rhodothermaceae bacterium]